MRNKFAAVIWLLLMSCNSKAPDTVTDIDGHVYHTVTIGNQVWMADNLQVTRYRNGDPIPGMADASAWSTTSSGAWCCYKNDTNYVAAYGRLYNWHAVNDNRQLAPEGWHIPTESEITTLITALGGDTLAAGKLKATGTSHWLPPNTGASNETGFAALPGGYRFGSDGTYHTLGSNGYWWSATTSYELYAWTARLYTGFADVKREPYYKTYGFAVRCIKD